MKLSIDYGKIGCGLAIAGGAFSVYLWWRTRLISQAVELTVDELSHKTTVDISEAVIEAAVQRAVNRELQSVTKLVTRRLYDDIHREVQKSVHMSYAEIKSSVSDEVARQVKNIDMRAIEKEAVEKAKVAIAEKFDGKLDSLLDEFNENLNNVSKIYSSIAKTMSEKA